MVIVTTSQPESPSPAMGVRMPSYTRQNGLHAGLFPRVWVQDSTSFQCSCTRRDIGDLSVSLANLTPFHLRGRGTRTTGDTHVGFVLNGSMGIGPPGGPLVAHGAGSAYAVRQWADADVEAVDRLRILDIRLPDTRLQDRGVRVRSGPIKLDAAATTGIPLRLFAQSVLDAAWRPNPGSAEIEIVVRVIEDLVVGLFLDARGYSGASDELREGLRARASAFIAAEHHHCALNPTLVAAHLGVSLRHLQRAFEGSGTTVAQAILTRRTESAAILLRGLSTHNITMSEVAGRAGFSSTYELRAAFKSHYGALPSHYRQSPHDAVRIATGSAEFGDKSAPLVAIRAHGGA